MSTSSELAINGGEAALKGGFPGRRPFGKEDEELVLDALRSQCLFYKGGTHVSGLCDEFAAVYGAKHAVACSSGTAALHLAVGAVDPNPGDEIITTPITDLGTIVPILYQNAVPVFADVDVNTANLDPGSVKSKITDRTRAIILVHLCGNPAPVEPFVKMARDHGIMLIEDCSQSHVTKYKDKYVGTYGDIGTFSFQQSKHMTTGDGGCVITDDDALAEKMLFFADKNYARQGYKGDSRTYFGLAPNYRMNELTGAVARAQLRKVRSVVERRIAIGKLMQAGISQISGVRPPTLTPDAEYAGWIYPLWIEDASKQLEFQAALAAEGLGTGIGYIGKPIYLCTEALWGHKTYGDSGFPFTSDCSNDVDYSEGACPNAEEFMSHTLTFAYNEAWADSDVDRCVACIKKVADAIC